LMVCCLRRKVWRSERAMKWRLWWIWWWWCWEW
jgi:hypothetical protein